jgi:hypothetical protein
MKRWAIVAGGFMAAVALTGCNFTFIRGRKPDSPTPALARKPVARKEAPHSLYAADRTRCTVSEEKFNRTALGDHVWCVWTPS